MNRSKEHLSDFHALPWCRALYSSPDLRAIPTPARRMPAPNPTNSNTFFGSTLAVPAGVRAVQSFISNTASGRSSSGPVATSSDPDASGLSSDAFSTPPGSDWLILYSLGTGLNGPAGIVHGGFVMSMLDGCMAIRAHTHVNGRPVLTVAFEAEFLKMVAAPCVVLARGRVVAEEEGGKFLRLAGELFDGEGQVLVRVKARFRVKRPKGGGVDQREAKL